jgi:hypothetical protein
MKLVYKNLILSFAIILISTIGAFAQKDDDKKPPKDDGPKVIIKPKIDDKKPTPTPKPDPPKKPSSILIDTRNGEFENGILKVLIG